MKMTLILVCLCVGALVLSACGGRVQNIGKAKQQAFVGESAFHMPDCVALPYKTWGAKNPSAVVIAVHGFNDYHNAFKDFATKAHQTNTLIYAYDQRGFGNTPNRGIWATSDVTVQDLLQVTYLVQQKHPNVPVYWMGESMGGAIVMVASKFAAEAGVKGVVLCAPGVWGWRQMPPTYVSALGLANYFIPWMKLSGEGVKVTVSDNQKMLNALGADPLVIKKTRVDAMHGVVELMEEAEHAAPEMTVPALILYGSKDELIPPRAVQNTLNKLPRAPHGQWKIVCYTNGYHMLFRDLQGDKVIADILAWVHGKELPSSSSGASVARIYDPQHRGFIPIMERN